MEMKVSQFYNKNQFIIRGEGKVIFQSYDSTIAVIERANNCAKQQLIIGRDWDYSKTTLKHLYMFLDDELSYNYIGLEGYSIASELRNSKNKRAYIQKLIDNKMISYREDLR